MALNTMLATLYILRRVRMLFFVQYSLPSSILGVNSRDVDSPYAWVLSIATAILHEAKIRDV
jgi:hypothetical protein